MRDSQKQAFVELVMTLSWVSLFVFIMVLCSSEAFADWASDALSRAISQLEK